MLSSKLYMPNLLLPPRKYRQLGGYAKTSVSLELLKMINFHATGKFKRQY